MVNPGLILAPLKPLLGPYYLSLLFKYFQ